MSVKRFGPYILLLVIPLAVSGCGWTIGGAPLLASPPNGSSLGCAAVGTSYVFTWGSVPNVSTYVLEVYNNTTGVLVATTTLPGASATSSPTATVDAAALACGGAAYRWRVGAIFSGTSNPTPAWSGFWTFTLL